jgi:hypothetical protein
MSDYTRTYNFAAKDLLTTGDSGKLIKGTEVNAEFVNIETAIASKFDKSGGTVSGAFTVGAYNATFDSGVLFVDASNNRVGINDTTPSYSLDVTGTVNATGAVTFGSTLGVTGAATVSSGALTVSKASGDSTITAQATTSGDAALLLKKAASGEASYIGAYTGDSLRWTMAVGNATAESGSNAGSNFVLQAYGDAGVSAPIGTALNITRSTMNATFGGTVSVSPATGNAAVNVTPTSGAASVAVTSTSGNATATLTAASGDAFISMKKDGAEQSNNIIGYKGADIRWQLALGDNSADNGGGSNAGSDFIIAGYSDVGASITNLTLSRKFDTLTYSGAMSADAFTPSDRRLKDEIVPIPDPLWKVDQLTGCTFVRVDKRTRPRYAGVIAQDVQAILPEAVHENQDTGILSVSDAGVIGLLVEAVKALRAEVSDLRARLEGEP